MSKAFTKEDDDGGFDAPAPSLRFAPAGPFRLTATGAAELRRSDDARVAGALARADVLPPVPASPERAALGVTVHVEVEGTAPHRATYRLVSAEERALTGQGCSVNSPIGVALTGAVVGDVREVRLPRGPEELTVIALEGEG